MNSTDAARMILTESAALPDLAAVAREVYVQSSRGGQVQPTTVRRLTREAGLQGVFDVLQRKHGTDVVKNLILALEHETDGHALI